MYNHHKKGFVSWQEIVLKSFLSQFKYNFSGFKAKLLKFVPCEFLYSSKEAVCIHHIEDGSAFICSVELKAGEID